jgi:hypothetical protein
MVILIRFIPTTTAVDAPILQSRPTRSFCAALSPVEETLEAASLTI